ncbi:hypothetical protein [Citricoccus sp. GCM10030269]|uniref:hypothetical protein n=1 Tax=Citricoccus sp. GCM10030269 TaxID=3273388 RepID=UPI00361E2872
MAETLSHDPQTLSAWRPPHLLGMHRQDLLELFGQLPAPADGELDGEYSGYDYLGHTREGWDAGWARAEAGQGTWWLGKAFHGDEGYNRILNANGSTTRMMRFGVRPGESLIDGKPALLLVYGDFDNPTGREGLVDEVRRINDDLYVAACTFPAENGQRSEPSIIVLSGPAQPWVGVDDPRAEARL